MMIETTWKRLKDRLGFLSASAQTVSAPSQAPRTRVPEVDTRDERKVEEIILHIGSHKTGTSAIQLFLRKNSARLAERLDIALLTPHPWPLRFNAEKSRMDFSPEGFDIIGAIKTRKVLLTHESYSWINSPTDLAQLHASLKRHADKVTVILYLRRQDALAISMKQEGTKWIDCATAFGHELRALPSTLTPLAQRYLRFDDKVKRWADAFGKENLVLRIVDRSRL